MTKDDIIRMAREAGFSEKDAMGRPAFIGNAYDLERFAALVAAHEREKEIKRVSEGHAWTQEHWTEYEHAIAAAEREKLTGELINEAQLEVQRAVLAEREACAKLCEESWKEGIGAKYQGDVFAVAIRARSEK